MTNIDIRMASMSNAGDLGLRALADLSSVAAGHDYRVIGGHMVNILCHVYPTAGTTNRSTADADAGVTTQVAAGFEFHQGLLGLGYQRADGNRWEAPTDNPDEVLAIDLLVPSTSGRPIETKYLGQDGYGFDAIQGLELALSCDPLVVTVHASFTEGDRRTFVVRVPDVEVAVVLKALAWSSRRKPKDIEDLGSLMAVVHQHHDRIRWRLDQPCAGARGDAARVLRDLYNKVDRRQPIEGLALQPHVFGALIQRYVHT